jgi:hypothetical protein
MVDCHASFFPIFWPHYIDREDGKKQQVSKTLDFNPVLMPSVNVCTVKAQSYTNLTFVG